MLASFITAANCIVVIVYILFRKIQRNTIPNWLLFNQAIVDLLIVAQSIMYAVTNMVSLYEHYDLYLTITSAFELYTCVLALGILLLSTSERFIALKTPLFHKKHITINKLLCATVFVWVIASLPSSFYLIHYLHFPNEIEVISNFWIIGPIMILAGIVIVIFILYFTFKVITNSFTQRTSSISLQTIQWVNGRNMAIINGQYKKQRRLFKLFVLLTVVYILSYIPGVILRVLHFFDVINHHMMEMGLEMAYIVYMSSALFNPILTLCMKDDFKNKMSCTIPKNENSQMGRRNLSGTLSTMT